MKFRPLLALCRRVTYVRYEDVEENLSVCGQTGFEALQEEQEESYMLNGHNVAKKNWAYGRDI